MLIGLGFSACRPEVISFSATPVPNVTFDLRRTNSPEDYTSTVAEIKQVSQSNWWRQALNGPATLIRKAEYELTLENGEQVYFEVFFKKIEEDISLLGLLDDHEWHYLNIEDEINYFYKDADLIQIVIQNNVLWLSEDNENLWELLAAEKVLINDEEAVRVAFEFEGIAFGFYDPMGEFQEVFSFKEGRFEGVIE